MFMFKGIQTAFSTFVHNYLLQQRNTPLLYQKDKLTPKTACFIVG
jgi:hypothetical protein